eukprot:TRINITY_DN12935_c0_g1_i2.p1 TRINITY_DN12935_c0_g1~~TRINITY_DN12935_c0_g1_i2.p1  ORF type:complete len:192 (+),score=21.98 TRINITY_DN12935_c0_g1_i2:232-807(+)
MAYAVGCTEGGLRHELTTFLLQEKTEADEEDGQPRVNPEESTGRVADSMEKQLLQTVQRREIELEAESPAVVDGSSTPEVGKEVNECLLWVAIVFVTIHVLPQPVITRWSPSPATTSDSLLQWKGFCSLIAKAYYDQGMAWYSVNRLQMEQIAATGVAEPAALVSDRMRLVFTTLEVVDPRWGGLQDFPTL